MRLPRTLSLILALMLAAALPLRGYAAMAQCEGAVSLHAASPHAASPHAASPHAGHCGGGTGSSHSGGCGSCCFVAAASTAMEWTAPRMSRSAIVAAPLSPPPYLLRDRLDRPPRPAA